MALEKPTPRPSLEEFLQNWASHNLTRAAMLANPVAPKSEWTFARYQLGELAEALRKGGYAR